MTGKWSDTRRELGLDKQNAGYRQAALEFAVSEVIIAWLEDNRFSDYSYMLDNAPELAMNIVKVMQEQIRQNLLESLGKEAMSKPGENKPVEQMTAEELRYIAKYGYKTVDYLTGPYTWEWYDQYRYMWDWKEAKLWRAIVEEAIGPRERPL